MKLPRRRNERGLSSVEMMLLLPLFALLLFGGLEIGRAVALKMALDDGVWYAARYLTVHDPWDETHAVEVVEMAVDRAILGSAEVKVKVTDDGSRSFGSALTVYAEAQLPAAIPFLSPKPLTLRGTHTQWVEVYP